MTRTHSNSHGSIYVMVLIVSMIILVIGLGSVMISRAAARATTATADWSEAGIGAQSGIEYAIAVMNSSSSWRTDTTSGSSIGPLSIGRAAVRVALVDEIDGNLANDPTQPVRIYGAATVGRTSRVYSALAAPQSNTGLDVLRCAIHAAGSLSVNGGGTVSGGPLSCAGSLNNTSQIIADVEANTVSSSGFIRGFVRTGVPAKTMPDTSAWTALSAIATTIPWGSTGGNIDKQVLAAGLDTIGAVTNASGVYLINVPAFSTLTIHHSRFQATLLINLGLASSLTIQEENLWDPASSNLPTLLVQGGGLSSAVTIKASPNPLKESGGTNYNPAGAPYSGVTDADTLDSFPNELHGVFFFNTSAPVSLSNNVTLVGCLIAAGNVTISPTVTLMANPALLAAPPLGFSDTANIKMTPLPGSYRWEVADVNP